MGKKIYKNNFDRKQFLPGKKLIKELLVWKKETEIRIEDLILWKIGRNKQQEKIN